MLSRHVNGAFWAAGIIFIAAVYPQMKAYQDSIVTFNKADLPPEVASAEEIPQIKIGQFEKYEIDALARNMYFEAANQGSAGMRGVAAVTLNRLFDRRHRFGRTIREVVYQRTARPIKSAHGKMLGYKTVCQFSWVCEKHSPPRGKNWVLAQMLAKQLYLRGDLVKNPVPTAQYYMNPSLTNVRWNKEQVAIIGAHHFYK
jgi:spore germination cell wall hydrolase CwlJ-like protein